MGKIKRTSKKKSTGKINKKLIQKKLLSTFSLEELLSKAQDEIDTFQYEEAQIYCQEALKRDPEHLKTLEISANLCLETGNFDRAKHCLGRAITLAPENGFTKYLSMGQLLEGKDSLQCYLKGIEIIEQMIKESEKKEQEEAKNEENGEMDFPINGLGSCSENDEESEEAKVECKIKDDSLIRKLSNAYSAVAELYMSDLCDEEEAEVESHTNIQKAIESDSTNPEAYQHHANFLLIKQEFEKAKESITKSVSLWLPKYQAVEDGEAAAGSFDPVEVCPLTQSVRFQTARILIEVEEYQLAADVLEGLLGEDDEDVYAWYLLGWNFYLQENRKFEAKQHFEKAIQVHGSWPADDHSIIEHMGELLKELKDVVNDDAQDSDVEDLEREIDEMDVS